MWVVGVKAKQGAYVCKWHAGMLDRHDGKRSGGSVCMVFTLYSPGMAHSSNALPLCGGWLSAAAAHERLLSCIVAQHV